MNFTSLRSDRRQFMRAAAAAAASTSVIPHLAIGAEATSDDERPRIVCFTKFLQDLSYDELAVEIKKLGFDGVEATVRAKGHVLPERVEDDLPRMVEALRKQDIEIIAMATDVKGADPLSERVLKTAAGLGVKWYRMGFFKYDETDEAKPILSQLDELRPQLKELAALNRELGVQGLYQNHSDNKYVGATLWDLHRLIHDIPVEEIGSAFDIRHATIESGLSWPNLFKLMLPHIGAIFVKDYVWGEKKAQHVPLGTGRVNPKFFEMVKKSNYSGPFSLHVEYLGKEGTDANIAALKRDLTKLKSWLD